MIRDMLFVLVYAVFATIALVLKTLHLAYRVFYAWPSLFLYSLKQPPADDWLWGKGYKRKLLIAWKASRHSWEARRIKKKKGKQ